MNNTDILEKPYVVGVDVGGQTTKMGIVDMRGQVLSQTVIRTDTHTEVDKYIDDVVEALDKIINESGTAGKIRGIGVGAPNGNYYTGTIENAANIAWGSNRTINFSELLSARTGGMKVALTNDANAAAVGEMTYGAARGMKNFIMITLGTGVGSGIVINGEVVYGHDGFAGELGHTCAVRNNGRLCNCGKTGCLETYCSAIGVARTAREWLTLSDEPSVLRSLDSIFISDFRASTCLPRDSAYVFRASFRAFSPAWRISASMRLWAFASASSCALRACISVSFEASSDFREDVFRCPDV